MVPAEPNVSVKTDPTAAPFQPTAPDEEGGNPFRGLTAQGAAGEKTFKPFTSESADPKASGSLPAAGGEAEKDLCMRGWGVSVKETAAGRTVNPFLLDSGGLFTAGRPLAAGQNVKDGSVFPSVFRQIGGNAAGPGETDSALSGVAGEEKAQDLTGSLKRLFEGGAPAGRTNDAVAKSVTAQAGLPAGEPEAQAGKGVLTERPFGGSGTDSPQVKRPLSMAGDFSPLEKETASGVTGSGRSVESTRAAEGSLSDGSGPGGAEPKKSATVPVRESGTNAVTYPPSDVPKDGEGVEPARRARIQGATQEGSALRVEVPPGLAPGKAEASPTLPVNGQEMAARILEMRQTLGKNAGRVTLSLEPPSLGTLTMDVRVRDRFVETIIRADSFEAHQALKIGLEDLRSALHEQGFKADNLQILWQGALSAGDEGGSAFSFFRENGGFDRQGAFGGSGERSDPVAEPEKAVPNGESRPEGISIFA